MFTTKDSMELFHSVVLEFVLRYGLGMTAREKELLFGYCKQSDQKRRSFIAAVLIGIGDEVQYDLGVVSPR
ncbi:MAG: hypothetical protein V1792_17655 [Pseudomonadota bacterium]